MSLRLAGVAAGWKARAPSLAKNGDATDGRAALLGSASSANVARVSLDELFFTHVSDPARFREAVRRFDDLNAADPNRELINGQPQPHELLQAQRLCQWVMTLAPDASEVLRLAARSQHLCRWEIPRASYELTRAGYHQWRTGLKKFHAEKSASVLRSVGYGEDLVAQVQALNLKNNFPTDRESRVLEDALCLVFLQFQFAELAAKTEESKVINALQKSWHKMTEAGRAEALELDYGPREKTLLSRALG